MVPLGEGDSRRRGRRKEGSKQVPVGVPCIDFRGSVNLVPPDVHRLLLFLFYVSCFLYAVCFAPLCTFPNIPPIMFRSYLFEDLAFDYDAYSIQTRLCIVVTLSSEYNLLRQTSASHGTLNSSYGVGVYSISRYTSLRSTVMME